MSLITNNNAIRVFIAYYLEHTSLDILVASKEVTRATQDHLTEVIQELLDKENIQISFYGYSMTIVITL